MARHHTYYHVAPRYTPGSPACVDEQTARKVAIEERHAYERYCLPGHLGEDMREKAERHGLDAIAEARRERGKGWEVEDLITGRQFYRPFPRG